MPSQNPFEFLTDLLNPDQGEAPSLSDLNYQMASLDIFSLPDVTANISIEKLPKINASLDVEKLPEIRLVASLKSLPKILVDAGLDNLRIKELAPINVQLSLKPARFEVPFNLGLRWKLFGLNVWSLDLKGQVAAVVKEI